MKIQWKRNAVVATVLLFVCAAVYLNWRYAGNVATDVDADANTGEPTSSQSGGRVLGDAALVGGVPTPVGGESDADVDTETDAPATESGGYFNSARLSRQQSRDSALSLLREAAAQTGAEQEAIDEANRAIQTLAGYAMLEGQIENLVLAKGYSDCVAFMGANSISVVVGTGGEGLQTEDVAKITDIVLSETDYTTDQIKVLEGE